MAAARELQAEGPTDAGVNATYHFLDVGALKYGECTLVRFGDLSVLIDGSHEKDFEGQDGYDSIPSQLETIFGHGPPFPITLLVVTHCHADHIGCLPKLVSNSVIEPEWALITDPKLGFGRGQNDDAADLADPRTQAMAAVLREEDVSDLADPDLQRFVDAVATIEKKYAAFVKSLRVKGVEVIEYRGKPLPDTLMRKLRSANMELLGPSRDQLVLAAQQIARTNADAADSVRHVLAQDAQLTDVALYRRIIEQDNFDDVRNPRGSGMNCQSITLAFGPPEQRALLAGDMQFTDPNVEDLADEMAAFRDRVRNAGPYKLFKTTHHTSHNGQDEDLLQELGSPTLIVHSGGFNDATHPDPSTLTELKSLARSIRFARTDRNGTISVQPHRSLDQAIKVARGRLNNFTSNAEDPVIAAFESSEPLQVTPAAVEQSKAQVIIVNVSSSPIDMHVGGVHIQVKGESLSISPPPTAVAAALSLKAPDKRSTAARLPRSIQLGAGRRLPRLLFVTNSERLAANIGQAEAHTAIDAIRAAGQELCDLARAPGDAARTVRALLRSDSNFAGVVIAGGYDVVAAPIVDVLSERLRAELGPDAGEDQDNFMVWSDEPFGDIDGDHIAERPVSRIPDARDAALFLTALQAKALRTSERFGIRNWARPFAEKVWKSVPGTSSLKASERFLAADILDRDAASACHYFMLHGRDTDATLFEGEFKDGTGYTRAFSIDRVPARFEGIVFTGCCWGALTVSELARDATSKAAPSPRVAERSIALTYLKAGANAFIGCTGAHYSGPDPDEKYNFAASLHNAFWRMLPQLEHAASPTLFAARQYYGSLIAERAPEETPLDAARRLKNRSQFTCLGLGW